MRSFGLLAVMALIAVAGVGGWQWSLYKPQIDAVELRLARAQGRLETVNAAASRESNLQSELEKRELLLVELRGAFPSSLELDAFRASLDTMAQRHGVSLTGFDSQTTQHEFHEQARIVTKFGGPQEAIDEMIADLFLQSRYVYWEDADQDREEDEADTAEPSEPAQPAEPAEAMTDGSGDPRERASPESETMNSLAPSVETQETFVVYAISSPPSSERPSCRVDVTPVWMPPFKGGLDRQVAALNSACAKLDAMASDVERVERHEELIVETGHIQAIRTNILQAE